MPRSHTLRPTRTRPRLDLEALESRRLMSSFNRPPAPAQVYIPNSGATVSQISYSAEIELVDRVDVTPPSIVGGALVAPGRGGGIELTFSQPMDPASVGNPANYAVGETPIARTPSNSPPPPPPTSSAGAAAARTTWAKVRITSATYDPAARTVTLTSARPLKASAKSTVTNPRLRRPGRGRSAPLIAAGKLTDASGNPINGGGLVTGLYLVNGSGPANWIFLVSINGTGRGVYAHAGRRPVVCEPRLQDPVRLGCSIRLAPRRPPGERGRAWRGNPRSRPG